MDWKNLYKRPATPRERLRGEEPMTRFGRMCAKLGIDLIEAHWLQAKGRIERLHCTHQDRLVKKLRRRGICSHPAANVFLQRDYLPEHNRRFAQAAARPEDYHRQAPRASELDRIFRLESERVTGEGWVVRYENRFFQLEPQRRRYAPARSKVLVREGRCGQVSIEHHWQALRWKEISAPARPRFSVEDGRDCPPVVRRKWVPPADHPWRQAAHRAAERKASKVLKRAGVAAAAASLALPSASPKRSALRAPQGCAPGKANDDKKNQIESLRRGHF